MNPKHRYVGSELLVAVVMKGSVFWDITPFSPLLKVERRFRRKIRIHFQGSRVSQARKSMNHTTCKALSAACFMLNSPAL
jgi:hypothetical protein